MSFKHLIFIAVSIALVIAAEDCKTTKKTELDKCMTDNKLKPDQKISDKADKDECGNFSKALACTEEVIKACDAAGAPEIMKTYETSMTSAKCTTEEKPLKPDDKKESKDESKKAASAATSIFFATATTVTAVITTLVL